MCTQWKWLCCSQSLFLDLCSGMGMALQKAWWEAERVICKMCSLQLHDSIQFHARVHFVNNRLITYATQRTIRLHSGPRVVTGHPKFMRMRRAAGSSNNMRHSGANGRSSRSIRDQYDGSHKTHTTTTTCCSSSYVATPLQSDYTTRQFASWKKSE